MINKKLEKAINDQINAEIYSAYLYLSMSAYFETQNLSGFANWTYIQYQEEMSHAMKFFRYINGRGGVVELNKIDKPENTWKDVVAVFKQVLKHEQYVTSRINNLVTIAREIKDYATESFLQWYVDEQVEEESNAEDLLAKLEMVKYSKPGLLMMDKELQTRVFVDETLSKK